MIISDPYRESDSPDPFGDSTPAATPADPPSADPHPSSAAVANTAAADAVQWLEDIDSPRALQWVRRRSARTIATAMATKRFRAMFAEARTILDAPDRLPWVHLRGTYAYNFWRDATHPRGLWRRMPVKDFLVTPPSATHDARWETLLDVDAVAAEEGENWVYSATVVHRPTDERALCALSRGGSDAVVIREFDLTTGTFRSPADGGFVLPEAKTSAVWINADTLAVTTPLGPAPAGTGSQTSAYATESGYGRTVRLLRRGGDLDSAPVVWEGERSDVAVGCSCDPLTGRVLATRALDFHHATLAYLPHSSTLTELTTTAALPWRALPLPTDYRTVSSSDWLYLLPRTATTLGGRAIAAGAAAVVSWASIDAAFDAADTTALPAASFPAPELLFTPTPEQTLEDLTPTATGALVEIGENMSSRVVAYTAPSTGQVARAGTGAWSVQELAPTAGLGSTSVVSTDPYSSGAAGSHALLAHSGPTEPSSMVYFSDDAHCRTLAIAPARFDASTVAVEQGYATSPDGTRIPYFLMRNTANRRSAPTILYGYGGFEIAQKASYAALRGKLWVERGGTYVVAGIRGGGEYGPGWHAAALRENRPLAFADMAAVAAELISRGYCTRQQLGMTGGSNGGLLAGVMLTRYPQLFGAIALAVPLLDMLRYHRLLAGASWMAEYGDPDSADREYLAAYSPLHHVRPVTEVQYPPALVTTSTRDDRVHPGHARKMVALLEEAGQQVTYFENIDGGHTGAADNTQEARKAALLYAFFADTLGLGTADAVGANRCH